MERRTEAEIPGEELVLKLIKQRNIIGDPVKNDDDWGSISPSKRSPSKRATIEHTPRSDARTPRASAVSPFVEARKQELFGGRDASCPALRPKLSDGVSPRTPPSGADAEAATAVAAPPNFPAARGLRPCAVVGRGPFCGIRRHGCALVAHPPP